MAPRASKVPQRAPRGVKKRPKPVANGESPEALGGVDLGTDKLYFKIGEVAKIVGVEPYVLRYWETEFSFVRPQKSRTGQRVYRRRDVEALLKIRNLLYDQKFTIAGARQLLREAPEACEPARPAGAYLVAQTLTSLREDLAELVALVADVDGIDPATASDPAAFLRGISPGAGGLSVDELDPDEPRSSLGSRPRRTPGVASVSGGDRSHAPHEGVRLGSEALDPSDDRGG